MPLRVTSVAGGAGLPTIASFLSHSFSACQWMRATMTAVMAGSVHSAKRTAAGVSGSMRPDTLVTSSGAPSTCSSTRTAVRPRSSRAARSVRMKRNAYSPRVSQNGDTWNTLVAASVRPKSSVSPASR